MNRSLGNLFFGAFKVLAFVAALSAYASVASAGDGDSPFSFFGRMFKSNNDPAPADNPQRLAQNAPTDLVVRIDRLEAQIRQLTGTIEQLQYRNQQLEAQLKRAQDGAGPQTSILMRAPPIGSPVQVAPQAQIAPQAQMAPPQPVVPGRRSDAFDPMQNPTAPGSPQTLGTLSNGPPSPMGPGPSPDVAETPIIGAPGGRELGAPLDLTTIGGNQLGSNQAINPNALPPNTQISSAPQSNTLPPPPTRNLSATGAVASVLPPSGSPRDQYDLGYGYVQHKDYALAEDAFQTFLTKFPADKLVPEAQFWLGESRFQRQRYDAAAEAFLAVSTKHTSSAKAPEAMLRLGQSLAALGQREMACATLAEVGRKFPRATVNVRQGVEREQKRVKC
jgi:tol-pal system protein YbgF